MKHAAKITRELSKELKTSDPYTEGYTLTEIRNALNIIEVDLPLINWEKVQRKAKYGIGFAVVAFFFIYGITRAFLGIFFGV